MISFCYISGEYCKILFNLITSFPDGFPLYRLRMDSMILVIELKLSNQDKYQ